MTEPLKIAITLAASLALAGCSTMGTGKTSAELDPATVTTPAAFALASDVIAQDRATLDSLLPTEDPAFKTLRAAAEDQAPTLAAALARIDAARAAADGANANRLPSIAADGSVSPNPYQSRQFRDEPAARNFHLTVIRPAMVPILQPIGISIFSAVCVLVHVQRQSGSMRPPLMQQP